MLDTGNMKFFRDVLKANLNECTIEVEEAMKIVMHIPYRIILWPDEIWLSDVGGALTFPYPSLEDPTLDPIGWIKKRFKEVGYSDLVWKSDK